MKTNQNIRRTRLTNLFDIPKSTYGFFWIVLFYCTLPPIVSFGQTAGDYRSLNSGEWTIASNWETYNGTSWTTATTYPGQLSGNYDVTILAGDNISISTAGITTNTMGKLTINGTLILNGTTTTDVLFTLNTPWIYVTPALTPAAGIIFYTKSLLILPPNAIIQVWENGLRGDCSHHQEIIIGADRFAICHGAPGSILTFDELMKGGGSVNAIITPSSTNICLGSSVTLNGSYSGTVSTLIYYKWTNAGPQPLAFSPNDTSKNTNITPTTAGTYILRFTVTTYFFGVPFSNTESCTLVVNKKSTSPTAVFPSEDTIMMGRSATLTLQGGGGGSNETIRWYSDSCGRTLVGTGNNITVSPTATTTYFGRYENGYPCNSNTNCAQTTITVIPYANIWKGNIDTNFGLNRNWLDLKVPGIGENVTFDVDPKNDCILDSNRVIGNIINGSTYNLNTSSHNLTINGSIQLAGTGKIIATNSFGSVTFAGTAMQTLNASNFSANTIANMYCKNAIRINLTGNLTISSKLTLDTGLFSIGANTLTLNDSLKKLGGTIIGGNSSNLYIAGTGSNISLPAITLYNLSLNRTSGLTTEGNMDIYGALTLTNGILSMGPNALTFFGTAPTVSTGKINATHYNSKITFANPNPITLPSALFNGSVYAISMNGTGGITLGENISISKTLELHNGKINTGKNSIIMEDSSNNIIAANPASYIYGFCKKIGNTAFTFEIGDSTNYAPLKISEANGSGNPNCTFTAYYKGSSPYPTFDSTQHDASIARISRTEYWILNRGVDTNKVQVTLSWDSRSGGITTISDLLVLRWNGTKWVNHGNIGTTGNASAGTITSELISNFSPFTLGSLSSNNYLPISLLEFSAYCLDKKPHLDWITASETNNKHFEIEQSENAVDWKTIEIIPGAGNSNNLKHYSYTDQNAKESSYFYRLRSVDFDGTCHFSEAVFTNTCDTGNKDFKIYPIPTNGILFLKVSGNEENIERIDIYNPVGEKIYSHAGFVEAIDLTNQANGSYFIITHYNNTKIIDKFTIMK